MPPTKGPGTQCRYCFRSREDPNPFKQGRSATFATLPFVSEKDHCCVPCRNFHRSCQYTGPELRALANDCQSDAAKREAHYQAVLAYEDEVNNGTVRGGKVSASASCSSTSSRRERLDSVSHSLQSGVKVCENLGVFWSVSLMKRHGKKYQDSQLITYGNETGKIFDDSHGFPIGAKRIEKIEEDTVSRAKELCSNETSMREGQVGSVHAAAASDGEPLRA